MEKKVNQSNEYETKIQDTTTQKNSKTMDQDTNS